MDCHKAAVILFLFFDGELEPEAKTALERHLSGCTHCARRLDYTRKLLILVRQRCARQHAPPRLRTRILTSLPHRQELL